MVLLQVFALTAAVGHIGFNWDAFYRARGDTRPIAIWSFSTMLSFLAVPFPLLIFDGLDAFAYGMGVMTLVSFAIKGYFLTRLFDGFQMLRYAARALAPTVPAVALVALARAAGSAADRTFAVALLELGLFLAVTFLSTVLLERALLREVLGYLRRGVMPGARAVTP